MNQRRVRRMIASLVTPLRIVFRGRTLDLAPGAHQLTDPAETDAGKDGGSPHDAARCPAETKNLVEMFERGELPDFIDRMAGKPADGGS